MTPRWMSVVNSVRPRSASPVAEPSDGRARKSGSGFRSRRTGEYHQRYCEEVRGDDPQLASYLRIVERERDRAPSAVVNRSGPARLAGRGLVRRLRAVVRRARGIARREEMQECR
jgi:hypothetical protein